MPPLTPFFKSPSAKPVPLPVHPADSADWDVRLERKAGRVRLLASPKAEVTGAIGLEWPVPDWSEDQYLLFPGAVYGGNRMRAYPVAYSPKCPPEVAWPGTPPHIACIHRLQAEAGPSSKIDLLSGDLAFPACAGFDPHRRRGWAVMVPQATRAHGSVGFQFKENADRTAAWLRITTPGLRDRRYDFSGGQITDDAPSPDRGVLIQAGEQVTLEVEIEEFDCPDLPAFFARLFTLRGRFPADSLPADPADISQAEAVQLVITHTNRDSWWPEQRIYKTDCEGGRNPYQNGWVGGVIAQYALLALDPDAETRERCRQHLDRVFETGVSPSGLLWGKMSPDGEWRDDCWYEEGDEHAWRKGMTLVRRQGDALLYGLRACTAWERLGHKVPGSWLETLRGLAEVLAGVFEENGEWGQFLDQRTAEIRVGNSASGAIIPAALLEAAARFQDERLAAVACEGAEFLYHHFTARGLTTGGPGDAMQAPDSESAYALVESFWAVYQHRPEVLWLERTEHAVHQFASWVMPYDYPFPAGSEFHRLGIRSAGTVFANAQNAHAGAICTHSGRALLELYRATSCRDYLDLLVSIVNALPQLVSRNERPIHAEGGRALPQGWINERINTSDWDRNVGGVFYGSTWMEVSLLLTAAELPKIHARPDDGTLDNTTGPDSAPFTTL